jgi:hypothetical protein
LITRNAAGKTENALVAVVEEETAAMAVLKPAQQKH